MQASGTDGDSILPPNDVLAQAANVYAAPGSLVALVAGTSGNVGGSQAHNNMQPYLTLNWCIALQGIFPSPN
jgi:microcystin-dependent protein